MDNKSKLLLITFLFITIVASSYAFYNDVVLHNFEIVSDSETVDESAATEESEQTDENDTEAVDQISNDEE